MKDKDFTVIYWNTWFEIQNDKRDDGDLVCMRLEQLIDEYSPDVICLNEVYERSNSQCSIARCLLSKKYKIHYTPLITTRNNDHIGNLMAAKQKPDKISDHAFGGDIKSRIKMYKDYNPQFTKAEVRFKGININIVLTHLGVLVPADWRMHIKHRRNFDNQIRKLNQKNLIIGGDFNETKYMLPWFRTPKNLKRKTGSILNPTWRVNGKSRVIFANFDNVLYSTDGDLKLREFRVLPKQPSDHAPLLAQFSINK
jgi:endonuclease/exonuclease/phosphatase family metal-dependent hydrolase